MKTVGKTPADFRKDAEERLSAKRTEESSDHVSEGERDNLHELQVHQIELEMQNEELKRAHLELMESQAKYFDLFDTAPIAYLILDEKGLIGNCNFLAASMLGGSRKSLTYMPLSHFVAQGAQPDWYRFHRRIREAGQAEDTELRMVGADANTFWVNINARMVEGGGLWITLTDIGAHKRREALTEARLRLHAYATSRPLTEFLQSTIDEAEALSGSQMGFLCFVEKDDISFQAWSTNTQQQHCEIRTSVIHLPIGEAGVWADCLRLGKAVIHNDYSSIPGQKGLPQGHPRVIRELVVPVLRENTTVALLGVGNKLTDYNAMDMEQIQALADLAWDISQGKRSEERLKLSEARYADLARLSRTATWQVDAAGLFTFVGPESLAVYGYRPEELVGKLHFYDLHPQVGREEFKQSAFSVFRDRGSFINLENAITTKDGQLAWVATSGLPLLAEDGSLLGYSGSDTNISENKKLTEQLLHAQKMEAIGELAGGLAHDFNNMLSIINGFCILLQMDESQTDQAKRHVEKILSTTERAAELTASILAFSRKQAMNLQSQDLNPIVSGVAVLAMQILKESVALETHLDEGPLYSRVDSGQITQLLVNLITNARDAMPGGGRLALSTRSLFLDTDFISKRGMGKLGPHAVIALADSGTGMDEETKRKIFEPFFTTKEVGKGTGLGLPMAYGIAQQHDGFIDVTSEMGEGSTFEVYLPLVESPDHRLPVKGHDNSNSYRGDETILIAEDEADLRDFLGQLFARHGYRVILAVDGKDAVDKFEKNADAIELLLFDMAMPRKSGKEAYDEILRQRPGTRVLFASGYGKKAVSNLGDLGAFAEFIPKPINPAELLRKIREMLDP